MDDAAVVARGEQLKATVRRALDEVFVQGKVDAVDQLYTPDVVFDSTARLEGPTRDREEYKEFVREFLGAFAEIEIDVHEMVAEGDLVVARATMRAKHVGTYHNIPATRRRYASPMLIMVRADPSGICEKAWSVYDTLGMMQQLGALPIRPLPRALLWLIVRLSRRKEEPRVEDGGS